MRTHFLFSLLGVFSMGLWACDPSGGGGGSGGTGGSTASSTSAGGEGGSAGTGGTGGAGGAGGAAGAAGNGAGGGGGGQPENGLCGQSANGAMCAAGLVCCYPCGIPGCDFKCTQPCDPNAPACSNGCYLYP